VVWRGGGVMNYTENYCVGGVGVVQTWRGARARGIQAGPDTTLHCTKMCRTVEYRWSALKLASSPFHVLLDTPGSSQSWTFWSYLGRGCREVVLVGVTRILMGFV
jgi:hypothetical protein